MAEQTTFTIIKGEALSFDINIKENGTTLPLELQNGDSAVFSLINKKTMAKIIDDKPMVIVDYLNGKIRGDISAVESALCPLKRSSAEDGYIPRPNLEIVVTASTALQGDMTAFIRNVYVSQG